MEITLTQDAARTAGILLLAVVAVEWGGTFMLRLVRGRVPATPFQMTFSRAGHAHAGVLVILALVAQLFVGAAGLEGVPARLAMGIPLAAILLPAGFFFSAIGRGRTEASRWIVLVYLGAVSLAVGVVSLGIGLLTA